MTPWLKTEDSRVSVSPDSVLFEPICVESDPELLIVVVPVAIELWSSSRNEPLPVVSNSPPPLAKETASSVSAPLPDASIVPALMKLATDGHEPPRAGRFDQAIVIIRAFMGRVGVGDDRHARVASRIDDAARLIVELELGIADLARTRDVVGAGKRNRRSVADNGVADLVAQQDGARAVEV